MRFYEVDSSVDAIMSAAMVAQTRASNTGKQGKLSMNGFLQMLANAGIMMDYDGFKTVFDTNPQLKNVIAQFNKDEITFVGDSDDESAGYEEPQGDMPDDERVAKMAQRATKMRTREFVEAVKEDVAKKLSDDDKKVLSIVVDRIKMLQKEMEKSKQGGYDEDVKMIELQLKDHYDIAKLIQGQGDGYGLDTAVMDIVYDLYDKVGGKFEEIETEAELPPHLSKMFGKDGTQVDTRTDVMKQMRDIVDNKSAMEVTFGDGEQMVDMFTASVLVQVYDKVNPENKEAIVQRVGTIEKFTKLMPKLFNMVGSTKVSESLYDAYAIIDDNDKIVSVHSTSKEAQAEAVKVNGAVVPMPKGKGVGDIVEGSSPHKKGTEKYRKHMAAMHAGESVGEAWQAFKERSLTKAEKSKMKHYEKKLPKQDFIDRYGKEQGEAIYYATATKMAKKNA